jgi:hypothetical protein
MRTKFSPSNLAVTQPLEAAVGAAFVRSRVSDEPLSIGYRPVRNRSEPSIRQHKPKRHQSLPGQRHERVVSPSRARKRFAWLVAVPACPLQREIFPLVSKNNRALPNPGKAPERGRFHLWARARKPLISAFVILNITGFMHANRPFWLVRSSDSVLEAWGGYGAYRVKYAGWVLARYEHAAGLDNRWEMFSTQPRFNWWFDIKGVNDQGAAFDLEVPSQGNRSVLDTAFFDFREAKYTLNLYANPELRARYANYLCRQSPVLGGRPIVAVRITLWHQPLRTPHEASVTGRHLVPQAYSRIMDEIPCRMAR